MSRRLTGRRAALPPRPRSRHITAQPYDEHAELHGYCGAVALLLARAAADVDADPDAQRRWLQSALVHYTDAVARVPNHRDQSVAAFLTPYTSVRAVGPVCSAHPTRRPMAGWLHVRRCF